jgi:membrane associated rhomboid family serine protease
VIPIGDSPRSRSFPYVNVAIIVINFAVFFYELSLSSDVIRVVIGGNLLASKLDLFIFHWGNIPACTFDAIGWDRGLSAAGRDICAHQPRPAWTIVTAMFMQGGWLHVLGNMLFLWIFGDNVEDAMGHALYAVFYVVVGVLAGLTYGIVSANDLQPVIGASGAIAGVMGAYIVLFPRATVAVVIPIFFFIPFPLPAFILIGLWFVVQLFDGFTSLGANAVGAGGGVAYFAHVGGFVAGALLVNVFAVNRARVRDQTNRHRGIF